MEEDNKHTAQEGRLKLFTDNLYEALDEIANPYEKLFDYNFVEKTIDDTLDEMGVDDIETAKHLSGEMEAWWQVKKEEWRLKWKWDPL